jgi:hypothetical protein
LKRLTREAVDREIAGLEGLDITALQNRWRELYKLPPPFKIRSGFLRRAIAYRLQELLLGGLKLQTKRELRRIAERARLNRAHSGGKPSAGNATTVDSTLVTVVARAFDWFERLATGEAKSINDIAEADGFDAGYVSHVLPLAFMAPTEIEDILAGTQPADLTADRLIWRAELAIKWSVLPRELMNTSA